jgi:hypothetical protein
MEFEFSKWSKYSYIYGNYSSNEKNSYRLLLGDNGTITNSHNTASYAAYGGNTNFPA